MKRFAGFAGVAIILLLSAGVAGADGTGSAPVNVPVSSVCIPVIVNFSADPASGGQCRNMDFWVTTENLGNIGSSVSVAVDVFNGTVKVYGVNLSPLYLSNGASASTSTQWFTGSQSPWNYSANATVMCSSATDAATVNFTISAGGCPAIAAEETQQIANASKNENASLEFTNTSLAAINFTALNNLTNVTFNVVEYTEKPAGAPACVKSICASYISISYENITSADVGNLTIVFKVSKALIQASNIDTQSISLCRYSGGSWACFDSTKINETDQFEIRITETLPGLSIFAVGAGTLPLPPAPPPVLPAGGAAGGGALEMITAPVISITPPPEKFLRFTEIPILFETAPGENVSTQIIVTNPGTVPYTNLKINVSGLHDGWVKYSPEEMSLEPGEAVTLNVTISVPEDAYASDYAVRITIGEIAENFFILRIKSHGAEYGRPTVSRKVEIYKNENITRVSLVVKNADKFVKRLEIKEEIPKTIAQDAGQLNFTTQPTILSQDPTVKFVLNDVNPFEERVISYDVPKIPDEYSPYVYWPIKQVNIYYTYEAPKIKIEGIAIPLFSPGVAGEAKMDISNLDVNPVEISTSVEAPAGWRAVPQQILKSVSPGKDEIKFSVTPPSNASVGTYILTFRVSYAAEDITMETTAVVQTANFLVYIIPVSIAVGLALFVRMRISAARKAKRMRDLRLIEYRQRMRGAR